MFKTMRELKNVLVYGAILIMPMFATQQAGAAMDMETGHDMSVHHQHIMLNHALGMTLEGYNLVMLGEMGMAKGVDELSVEHGNMMIKNGTAVWNEIMTGETMMGMHGSGKDPMKDPVMGYTHKLAEKQLKVIDLLGKMPEMADEAGMTMHHQHIALNHVLKMGLEAANLIMLGEMGMAEGVDEVSVEHGRMMLKNAKALFNEIMSGKEMMGMHEKGTDPTKDAAMGYTHKLAEAQLEVLTLLEEMPAAE